MAVKTLTPTLPVVETEPEQVTPLKVSEAIRLGAMTSRQLFGRLRHKMHGVEYACAIGAASNAYGIPRRSTHQYENIDQRMGPIPDGMSCPVTVSEYNCCRYLTKLPNKLYWPNDRKWSGLITHMNDAHQLPREWIADFLESVGY